MFNSEANSLETQSIELLLQEQPTKAITLVELSDALELERESFKRSLEAWFKSFSEGLQVKLVATVTNALSTDTQKLSMSGRRSPEYCRCILHPNTLSEYTLAKIGAMSIYDELELDVPDERWRIGEEKDVSSTLPRKSKAVQTDATTQQRQQRWSQQYNRGSKGSYGTATASSGFMRWGNPAPSEKAAMKAQKCLTKKAGSFDSKIDKAVNASYGSRRSDRCEASVYTSGVPPSPLNDASEKYSEKVGNSSSMIPGKPSRKGIFDGSKQEEVLSNLRAKVVMHELRLKKISTKIVNHTVFDACCALMILGNSVLIGVGTQHAVYHDNPEIFMEVLGHFFSAYFLLEMLLRFDALGMGTYFCGDDSKWNWFDFSLVLMSIADLLMQLVTSSSSSTRALKTIKMMRIMRVFRIFRFFSDLSLLTVLIAHSLKSLMWSLVLIALIIYVFGILFTQVTTMYAREGWGGADAASQKAFGSLDRSIYHLVCAMMGGISWIELGDVALEMGVIASGLFFFFISFMILAVLNIINAVFVDNAIQTANSEREFMVQRELDLKAGYVGELISVFNELDADHSGDISWEELQNFFCDQRVQVYFEAMGISGGDLVRLWELLDEDKSGSVGLHEFLDGCFRFKGHARSIDMHFVLKHCARMQQDVEQLLMLSDTQKGGRSDLAERYPSMDSTSGNAPSVHVSNET